MPFCSSREPSNANTNTPVNFRSKILTGSSKVDSSKKKPASQISKLATSTNQIAGTPPTVKPQISSILKPGSTSKTSFTINPICKGVDYTEVMLKKAQFGYTGPGYIVEFDCDQKHLRGLRVEKGLWKVTTRACNKTEAILGIGMNYIRIDEPEKCTPLKQLTNYDFSYKPQNDLSMKGLSRNIMTSFSSDDLHLESKQHKTKKSLRWAEDLVRIEERSQPLTPNGNDSIHEQLDNLTGTPGSSKPKRKLRKSLSMSDLNEIGIEAENDGDNFQYIENTDFQKLDQDPEETNKENLNVTYDKDETKTCSPYVSKVIHYVVHVSPAAITNSSFLDQPMSRAHLQPPIEFPIISPVKTNSQPETKALVDNQTFDVSEENCNEEGEKELEHFVRMFEKKFTNEKGIRDDDADVESESILKDSFKKAINDQNSYNMLLNFDKLEQMMRRCKMEIIKLTLNKTN